MFIYEMSKFFHILGASAMLGATLCNGVLHGVAFKSDDIAKAGAVLKGVMLINRYIMVPGFLLIIINGFILANYLGLTLDVFWYWFAIVLTMVLVFEFLWGYKIEEKLAECVSENKLTAKRFLPDAYKILFRSAIPIGGSATLLSMVVLFLMIFKPY